MANKKEWNFVNHRKKIPDDIRKLETSSKNLGILTMSGQIWLQGDSTGKQISNSDKEKKLFHKQLPEKIIDMSLGQGYHFVISESGALYGAGNNFLTPMLGLTCTDQYLKIDLEVKALRVFTGEGVMFVEIEGSEGKELWSAGKSKRGLLGIPGTTKTE
jgi:hypothetical protein